MVGWLAGAALLWSSERWSVRDKLIGTLVVPGGFFAAFVYLGATPVTGGSEAPFDSAQPGSVALLAVLAAAPVAAAAYLGWRLRSG